MELKKLSFQNVQGQNLSARLQMPADGKPLAFALFAHCFTCSKNLKAIAYINQALVPEKIAVMRFDFTELGESEGDFSDTNFSSNVEDLISAVQFLEQEYEPPSILIGHSLGGSVVLQAAESIPSSNDVVTIAAPSEPSHVIRLLSAKKE